MRQQRRGQAIEKGQHRDGGGHEGKSLQALVARRVHKQGEERHVKHNSLGVEHGDHAGLAEIVACRDVEHRGAAGLGQQHLEAHPRQVQRAQPLHGLEGQRRGAQKRRHTGHGQPHQHLVTSNHPHGGRQPAPDAALAGGRDQGQVPRAGNQQKQNDCGDKSAIVGYAKHGWIPQRHEAREMEFTLPLSPCDRITPWPVLIYASRRCNAPHPAPAP